jgi:hypothetical protein
VLLATSCLVSLLVIAFEARDPDEPGAGSTQASVDGRPDNAVVFGDTLTIPAGSIFIAESRLISTTAWMDMKGTVEGRSPGSGWTIDVTETREVLPPASGVAQSVALHVSATRTEAARNPGKPTAPQSLNIDGLRVRMDCVDGVWQKRIESQSPSFTTDLLSAFMPWSDVRFLLPPGGLPNNRHWVVEGPQVGRFMGGFLVEASGKLDATLISTTRTEGGTIAVIQYTSECEGSVGSEPGAESRSRTTWHGSFSVSLENGLALHHEASGSSRMTTTVGEGAAAGTVVESFMGLQLTYNQRRTR